MRRTRNTQETTVLPSQGAEQVLRGAGDPGTLPGHPAGASHQAGAAPQQPEEIVVRVRRHGRHLTIPVLLLFVVAGFGGFFIGTLPEAWMNLAAAGGAAVLIAFGVIGPLLGWLARRAVVTTRRVILHHGFFVRHRSEISLARVREVRSKQNPVQRIWGSGDIDLLVGAEATRIPDAPGVKLLHVALQELSERSYDEQVRATAFGM
ncbi:MULTISPECIES: PH domain-containing protein [Leucobacter]|uniref:PH domain-containing protein n=1 Tax=Leucobacter TaxID=55968 RepID=UPI0013C47225|nr:PH domain-containing protein [Leucobacter aridicollis]UTX53551.1 PH domain-containing protein [Leucobacter aridicollis]